MYFYTLQEEHLVMGYILCMQAHAHLGHDPVARRIRVYEPDRGPVSDKSRDAMHHSVSALCVSLADGRNSSLEAGPTTGTFSSCRGTCTLPIVSRWR